MAGSQTTKVFPLNSTTKTIKDVEEYDNLKTYYIICAIFKK